MRKGFILITVAVFVSGLGYVLAQEEGQPQLRDLTQKRHDAEISQEPHESGALEPEFEEMRKGAQKTPLRVSPASPSTLRDKLAQGWRFFKKGDYARAIPF